MNDGRETNVTGAPEMKQLPLLLLILLATCSHVVKPESDAKVANPSLRAELLKMENSDQDIRLQAMEQFKRTGEKVTIPMLWVVFRMSNIDRANTGRMHRIVDQYGWPGKTMVGDDGAGAAFLLLQHADRDTAFQKRCLPLLQEAAAKGEASKEDMALLTDRVLVAEGKKQLYGTQCGMKDTLVVVKPIEDSANVDKRRAEVGLYPLSVYIEMTKFVMKHGSAAAELDKPGTPAHDSLEQMLKPYEPSKDSTGK
jgi:hypothetical protein